MDIIPPLEFGILNAWVFMIWPILSPIISFITIKNRDALKIIRTSVPIKYEKKLNFFSFFALILGFIYSIFVPLIFNSILFYIGLLFFIFGFIFDLSVMSTIRKIKFNDPFTEGPYRYSRHPIYLALIMMIIGISLMSYSWIYFIIMIISIFHMIIVGPAEEAYCLEKFGKRYQDYIKKTPRWFGLPK